MKKILLVNMLLFGMSFSLYADGIVYSKKACDRGNSKQCTVLAHMYRDGIGVKQNYSKAVKYYSKACDDGYVSACNNLAVRICNEQGIKKNNINAAKLFHKACKGADSDGCHNLKIVKKEILNEKK